MRLGAIAFQQHVALHSNPHATAAGLDGDFLDVEDVPALAIIDRVHKSSDFLVRHGNRPLNGAVVACLLGLREGPAERFRVDEGQLVEQLRIHAAEKGDCYDLCLVVDGVDPAGQASLARVAGCGDVPVTDEQR